jgi:hypothetical protein
LLRGDVDKNDSRLSWFLFTYRSGIVS